MKSSRHFARALVDCLRNRVVTPQVVEEIERCVSIVHAADKYPGPLVRKLLGRHTRRPGPKPNLERDKRIRSAIHWARFNRASLGSDAAIRRAAVTFNVPENVIRNAYKGHVRKFRKLKTPK
ncbi:MAG TPA: hypothetical protein VIJ06_01210 [Methylovirgula sp.]